MLTYSFVSNPHGLFICQIWTKEIFSVIVWYKNAYNAVILISLKLHVNESFYSWFLREGVFLESVYERVVNSTSWLKSCVQFVLLFAKRNWCSSYRFESCNSPHCLEVDSIFASKRSTKKLFLVGSWLLSVLIYDSEFMAGSPCFPVFGDRLMIRQVGFLKFFLIRISPVLPKKKNSSASPVRNWFKTLEIQCPCSMFLNCSSSSLYFSFNL